MTRTEYQQHLLEEYASYLRKAIANNRDKVYHMTAEELAASLLKAFEKGVMRGILFESQNDIQAEEKFAKVGFKPKCEKTEKPAAEDNKIDHDKAMQMLADMFLRAFTEQK